MKNKICSKCKIEKSITEFYKRNNTKNGCQPKCKSCERIYTENHKEDIRQYKKLWARRMRENKKNDNNWKEKRRRYTRIYEVNRRKYDLNFRLLHNLRTRLNIAINRNIKSMKTMKLLGCTVKQLKQYLQNQFKKGMSWNNYGIKGWHIDHIIPCSKFDLTNVKQQKQCFHYTNLQPLWAKENMIKGGK